MTQTRENTAQSRSFLHARGHVQRTWLKRLIAILLGTGLALAAGECLCRFGLGMPSRQLPAYTYDHVLGWRHTSNLHMVSNRSDGLRIPITLHSDGHRGELHSRRKPPGTRRVAVLGDSFTEAFTVRFEDSFPSLLENILITSDAGSWEVLEFGVSSYGTVLELLTLQNEVLAFDPDVVILQMCVNDFWDNIHGLSHQLRGPWAEFSDSSDSTVTIIPPSTAKDTAVPNRVPSWRKAAGWAKWHSALVYHAATAIQRAQGQMSAQLGVDGEPACQPTDPINDERFERARLLTFLLVREMAETCRSRGIRFQVYVNPSTLKFTGNTVYDANKCSERFVLNHEVEKSLLSFVENGCLEHAIAFQWSCDLFTDVIAVGKSVTPPNDPHWNELGHQLVAADLARTVLTLITATDKTP